MMLYFGVVDDRREAQVAAAVVGEMEKWEERFGESETDFILLGGVLIRPFHSSLESDLCCTDCGLLNYLKICSCGTYRKATLSPAEYFRRRLRVRNSKNCHYDEVTLLCCPR